MYLPTPNLLPYLTFKKFEHRNKIENPIRLTNENKPNSISKWQVALKEVQPLHEIPLWFPNELNLHFEGKDAVPQEHRTRYDYRESQESSISSLIAALTFKILPVGWSDQRNATPEEVGKQTTTSLITNNPVTKEAK